MVRVAVGRMVRENEALMPHEPSMELDSTMRGTCCALPFHRQGVIRTETGFRGNEDMEVCS